MSKPELFIIESLELNDEKKGYFEDKIWSGMLNLSEKKCIYYYIRTRTELIEILDEFYMTDYRYLQLSCHASRRKMATTFDSIFSAILGRYFHPFPHIFVYELNAEKINLFSFALIFFKIFFLFDLKLGVLQIIT